MRMRTKLRDESGNALVIVIIVSMVIGSLVSLALDTGRQAEWSSASDRNREASLGLAEAGVHEDISRVETAIGAGYVPYFTPVTGSTPQGTYSAQATRCPPDASDPQLSTHQTWCNGFALSQGYVIDATGTDGTHALKRSRHIRVSLVPPLLFPGDPSYTIFSYTSISLSNGDGISEGVTPGDLFANDSITLGPSVVVNGSVTSAQSWIDSSAATKITGNVWSGGYNPSGNWAMNLSTVGGSAKASVTAPTNLQTCDGKPSSNYTVKLGTVSGDVTTWGTVTGGSPGGAYKPNVCTAAAAAVPLPEFTYNQFNYDPSTLNVFNSVGEFNSWVSANSSKIASITGTFVINEPSPSQSNRVNLSNWNLAGDLTVITNAPIFSSGITDANLPAGVSPKLVLVSHYAPPANSSCDANSATTDCAVYIQNQLNVNAGGTCSTGSLVYADKGPVALKNSSNDPNNPAIMCGVIVSDGLFLKNNLDINFDARFSRTLGFGSQTFEIGKWEELPL